MINLQGQVYVTNLKEVSPRMIVGDIYCHQKVSEDEFITTFIKAKFVGEALYTLLKLDIKNKDKIFLEKGILGTSEYTNKNGGKTSKLEATIFKIDEVNNTKEENKKGKFDR